MGRHPKVITSDDGPDRRETGYYSTPKFVADFLTRKLLEINPTGQQVIDPAIGKGELVAGFVEAGKQVTGIDITDFWGGRKTGFLHRNFIELYQADRSGESGLDFNQFDYWILNPPYNCHELDYIQGNKSALKKLFADVGVHNMYAMFLSAVIDLAREGATIGVITLDSFLTAQVHEALRRKILEQTTIHHLLLCPTDLFRAQKADVRTCVLILEKRSGQSPDAPIQVCNRSARTEAFQKMLQQDQFSTQTRRELVLPESQHDHLEFLVGVPSEIRQLFTNGDRLADRFACVTGISTGNDRQYLRDTMQPGFTMPFYKNPGKRKFFVRPNAYLCDDFLTVADRVKTFVVRNPTLLMGKPGITCSSMGVEFSACYLPAGSTFGVNPNIICPEADIWWLLAYLNSPLVSYLIRGVLIRSNMVTSGYVARLPLPNFDDRTRQDLADRASEIYDRLKFGDDQSIHPELNAISQIILTALKISPATQNLIMTFCADIVRHT
jgi:hypothetical protein